MNRRGIFAYWLVAAVIVLLTARETIHASLYVYQERVTDPGALGVFGWSIATLAPLALSFWCWRLARPSEMQWLLHLLFIPCAVAAFRLGASILFLAAGVPDGDSIEGYTLTTASCLLALALLVHAAALARLAVAKISRKERTR